MSIDFLFTLFWWIAAYKVLKHIFNFLRLVYRHYIRKGHDLIARYGKGSWVFVTGATDGIGKGLALDFAKRGFNIILVSRTLSKLEDVAKEIKAASQHNIQVKVIEFDFTILTTEADYRKAFSDVVNKDDVSIIVNNVGYTEIKKFDKLSGKSVQDIINLNVTPQAIISQLFIPKLLTRKSRSAIINLSSFASQIQAVGFIEYNAVKTFNNHHSLLMSEELKENVDVLSVRPMWVATPLAKKTANWYHTITTEMLSNSVLNQLGHDNESFGHFIHEWQARAILNLPNFLLNLRGINSEWQS